MSIEAQMRIAVVLSAYDKMSKQINDAVNKSKAKLDGMAEKYDKIADKAFNRGRNMVAAGVAVGAPLYKAIEAATDFESKMIDIRKQMQQDTPESVAKMTKQVFQLGRELPLATDQIQDMIAAGLRMGIAEDKIIDYTKQVTKMATAFDIPANEIADSMGKIANVFKIPIDKVGDFADAINYLDDNTMAKGPELIDVLQRIGGSARNLSANNAAALASTMLSVGESAETSGTAISGMINNLSAATMQSSKFQKGMQMLGLNSEKVQKLMSSKDTAQSTIITVLEKINALDPSKQTEMLIRLFGREQGPKLMKLANNLQEYRRQLNLVQGSEKGSMNKEYQKRVESSAAKWQIFKNRLQETTVKIGTALLPSFIKLVEWAGKIIDKVSVFIEKNSTLVKWLGLIAAGFTALAFIGGYLNFVIGGVASLWSMLCNVGSFLTSVVGGIAKVFQFLRLVILANPILAIATAIAIVAILIIKNWNKIKPAFKAVLDWIVNKFKQFVQPFVDMWNDLTDWISSTWNDLIAKATKIWNDIGDAIIAPLKWVKEKWEQFTNWISDKWNGVCDFFTGKSDDTAKAMTSPAQMMIDKMKKDTPELNKQMAAMAQGVDDYLPHSPAKKGALSRLHKVRIVETLAEAIKPNSLACKMQKVASGAAGVGIPGVNNKPGMNVSFNITLHGGASKSDAQTLTTEIKKQFGQLMKQYGGERARVSFS
jgi:TP901 family phage tail tape measure protein